MQTTSMFQFTHPGRGATQSFDGLYIIVDEVSIHAPREGCDCCMSTSTTDRGSFNSRTPGGVRRRAGYTETNIKNVSIHAPREGCDLRRVRRRGRDQPVSIHAPQEGCDSFTLTSEQAELVFQFTHPGRGATRRTLVSCRSQRRFNSRTPGGVRHDPQYPLFFRLQVSIHAPREGCDMFLLSCYSHSPRVSIHAPREGCDQ